jgi:hypothetical protein
LASSKKEKPHNDTRGHSVEKQANHEDGTVFEFLVTQALPTTLAQAVVRSDSELTRQADFAKMLQPRVERVKVSDDALIEFWNTKVTPLAKTITQSSKDTLTGYEIDEIEFTIGVGFEGGLAFVAKASANAQVSVKVRKKHQ